MKTAKKKALVFIDHDMVIRHFIKSHVFDELEEAYDVTYVFNEDPGTKPNKQWIHTDVHGLGLERVEITGISRGRMGSWYKLYAISVLHNQRGTPNYGGRKKRMYTINGVLRTNLYALLSLPGIFPFVKRYYLEKQGVFAPLEDFITEQNPDLIIYPSVLTGYYMNELLVLTKQLGIPFIILMNSWDNPSQKAVTTGHPDRLAVWGEESRQHAITYLGMPDEKIEIFGAAQFQLYREPVKDTDQQLRAMFKVPENKPIVLYGGVSKSINESRHLRLLEEAIESGAIPDCHILYRPHPWRGQLVENEENFFDIPFKHISMDPFMEGYYRRVTVKDEGAFDMADYEITRKLLHMISGTISSLSTILLETVLHGKPTIAFMPTKDMETKYGRSAAIGARLAHFDGLWSCPGVGICRSDNDLAQSMTTLFAQSKDSDFRKGILEYANRFVDLTGPTYGQRLVALADELIEHNG